MEQIAIGSRDGQTPRHHYRFPDLLHRRHLPAPTRGTVMQVLGNGVPRAVGQGRVALLSGLEVPMVNGAGFYEPLAPSTPWSYHRMLGMSYLSSVPWSGVTREEQPRRSRG